jgi:hypothetical protein
MANISGTNLAAGIVPFTTEDTYATHSSEYGKGGWHEVLTSAERDAIPAARLADGMACYVVDEGKLYVRKGTAWEEFAAGTGGGTVTNTFNLTTTDERTGTLAKGSSFVVTYVYESLMGVSASVQYLVNGVVKDTAIINSGTFTKDVGSFLSAGTNTLTIKVTDDYNSTKVLTYTLEVIDLTISSTFDDSVAYTSDVSVRYTPVGNLTKTIHFILDGDEYATQEVTVSGRQQTQVISGLTHGAHILKIYATGKVGATDLKSNELYFSIIYVEEGRSDVIVACSFAREKAKQGETLDIPYVIYDPNALTAEVKLYENDKLKSTLTVDRTKQHWNHGFDTAGTNTLSIRSGETSRYDHTIEIEAVEIDANPVTENLELHLTSKGRSNQDTNKEEWKSGSVSATLTGFNFASNGWVADDQGNTVLRINAGARVEVPLNVFGTDFRANGKTIEFELATRSVLDYDSVVVTCMDGKIGLKVTAQQASLTSEQSSVETKFKEDEHVRVSFVVEPRDTTRLIYTYINGIISGLAQYPYDDNFVQTSPKGITLGSDTCGLDIYNIRVYDSSLSHNDMLKNFIADTADLSDKISLYTANNIYDTYGNIVYTSVNSQVPCMTIIGDLPSAKGDEKTVRVKYEDKVNPAKNFDYSGVGLDIQGTSSQYYPRKNYKIKLPEAYKLRENSIPETTFTCKADYMESSHSHNTGITKIVNSIYSEKVPPQLTNSAVRTAIDGFPIAMFYQASDTSPLEYYGVFNFNNDKGNNATWGFTSGCESWEFCNNTADRCLFKTADFTGDVKADLEARYPKDFTDYTNLKRLFTWVVSCNGNPTKFKSEVEQYFNKEYLLAYYIVTELFGMVDSRAKNLFLNTYDGRIWYPVFYDCDTAMGLNNEGVNDFGFGIEYHDKIGTKDVWNGESSVLWNLVEQAFEEEITELYKQYRNDGKLSYAKTLSVLEGEQIAKICAAQYNSDAEFKYVKPLVDEGSATYLYVAQGSRLNHLKWWLFNRFNYIDSKYVASDYAADYMTLRLYTPDEWAEVAPNANITITPYADQYLNIKYGSYVVGDKGTHNVSTEIEAPNITFNDTETIVYGASRLLSVGDLSGLYSGTVDVSKAVKLSELVIGHGGTYQNTNLNELSIGNNELLKKLDVRNCPNLTEAIDVSGCANIEEVYAEGTSSTAVKLPNGGNVKKLHLPAVANLTIKNHKNITDFSVESYENVNTLVLENTNLNDLDVYNSCTNVQRVRLLGINWTLPNFRKLDEIYEKQGVDENGYFTEHAVLGGKVHITDAIDTLDLQEYKAKYVGIEITADTIVEKLQITFEYMPDDAVLTVNGEII